MAAKRSRDARRMKENQIAMRAGYLEKEVSLSIHNTISYYDLLPNSYQRSIQLQQFTLYETITTASTDRHHKLVATMSVTYSHSDIKMML